MKIEKDFKLLFIPLSSRKNMEDEWEWVGKIGEREIAGEKLEECLERILETTEAVEFELVPQKISYNEIGSYLLILKTER